jgi:hypothetical protein
VFNDLVALFNVEFCAMLSASDVEFSQMKFVLLLFLKGLKVSNACYFSSTFYLLLLKQNQFVSLFGLVGEFLPDG